MEPARIIQTIKKDIKREQRNQLIIEFLKFKQRCPGVILKQKCKNCKQMFELDLYKPSYWCSNNCRTEYLKDINRYKNGNIERKMRFQIISRDNFKCRVCGRGVKDGIILEIDHWNPKSNNGENNINNYVTMCRECNRSKTDCLQEQSIESFLEMTEEKDDSKQS